MEDKGKRITGVSRGLYRGTALVEAIYHGQACIELVYDGKEYTFETLGEATGFLDVCALVKSNVIVVPEETNP